MLKMNLYFVFFVCIFIGNIKRTKSYEGMPCGDGDVLSGTCREKEDCPVSINKRNQLISCGRYNLYCCPNKSTRTWETKSPKFRPPQTVEEIPENYPADQSILKNNQPEIPNWFNRPGRPEPPRPTNRLDGVLCGNQWSMGVCRTIFDCLPAVQQMQKYRKHNLIRCGFENDIEVVCCPNTSQNNYSPATPSTPKARPITKPTPKVTPTTKRPTRKPLNNPGVRKSVQACMEYSNEISQTIDIEFNILGGKDAAEGEFPHMAALGYRINKTGEWSWRCGGSLISDRYVLTAAHCVAPSREGFTPYVVRLGKTNILEAGDLLTSDDYLIENYTINPSYLRLSRVNDIALIRLQRPVKINDNIHPACLYTKPEEPVLMIISGWGSQRLKGPIIPRLQKADVKLVPVDQCNATYNSGPWARSVHENNICAYALGSDACNGDSGGPLQVLEKSLQNIYSVVGITATGVGCGGTVPGTYTKVYNFLDWIENIVW